MGNTNSKVEPSVKMPETSSTRPTLNNKANVKRENSGYLSRKTSLPVVQEVEENNNEAVSTIDSNSSQGLPNGSVKNQTREVQTRETTKSSWVESEVSIVISNASDYDTDSIRFTGQKVNTSTPLLVKQPQQHVDSRKVSFNDENHQVDVKTKRKESNDKSSESLESDSHKNTIKDISIIKKDNEKELNSNIQDDSPTKVNNETIETSNKNNDHEAAPNLVEQTETQKSKQNNTTQKKDANEARTRKMGTNLSSMEMINDNEKGPVRRFSRERKTSTDITQMEYLYRTSQDKARQRKVSVESQETPRRITGNKYPSAQANGDVVNKDGGPRKPEDDVLQTLPNGVTMTYSVEPSETEQEDKDTSDGDHQDDTAEAAKGDALTSTDEEEKRTLKVTQEKRVRITSPDPIKDADDFYNRLSMRMERSGYLKESPSVNLFEKTFKEYIDMAIDVPNDDTGIIIPSPPTTKKLELLKSLDFNIIDLHASRIPRKMMDKSLAEMTRFLIKPAGSSRIERVRAIFVWLVTTNLDNVDMVSDSEDDDDDKNDEDESQYLAEEFLQNVKDEEISHAELFQKMCNIAGIHCRTIEGITREYIQQPSNIVTETTTTVWSAVVIQQSWRLVDVSKAAMIYKASKKTESVALQKEKSSDSIFGNKKSPITDILDFYFFTDPEQFVFSNLPDEENFQFLPRPASYAEFTYLPFIKPHFFILGFQEVEKYDSVTETNDGVVTFSLRSPEPAIRKLACNFHKVEGKSHKQIKSSELRDYVYLDSDTKNGYFTIKANVPAAGTYVLEINGRNGWDVTDRNNGLCSYVIKCSKNHQMEPYTENDREEWGPGSDCYVLGFKPVSHLGGEVLLENGESVIEFEMISQFDVLHTLSHVDMDTTYLSNYVIHRIEGNTLYVHVRVPKKGDYALKLFTRKEEDSGIFVNTCTYLVRAIDNVPSDCLPFPKIDDGLVGHNKFFKELKMEIIRPKLCVLNCSATGKLKLKFNLAPNVHYLPEFKLCRGSEETAMHEYTSWTLVGLMGTFRLKFPQQGIYLFSLYAILPDLGDQVNSVYNAVITCNWPSERCFPYPTSLASWTPYYRLLCPHEVYLVSGTVVRFVVDIPDALRVSLIGNTGWQHLEKDNEGLWSNEISIEPGLEGTAIKMYASIEEGSKSLFSLLQFKIVSKEEMSGMETIQREYYQSAKTRVDKLKKSGEWQEPEIVEEPVSTEELDDGISDVEYEAIVKNVTFDDYEEQHNKGKSPKKSSKSKSKKGKDEQHKQTKKKRRIKSSKRRKEPESSVDISASTDALSESENPSYSKQHHKTDSEESRRSDESSQDSETDDVNSDNSWEHKMAEYEKHKKEEEDANKKVGDAKDLKAMKIQLIVNRLRAATKRKEKLELIRAIDDWKSGGHRKSKEFIQAERMLDIINLRDDLNTHLKNRNMNGLKKTLKEIEFKGYVSEIPYDVSQARSRLELGSYHSPTRHRQSTIDVQTLAEIRSYIRPPEVVHQIVVAMLLLMGVPEKNTRKWKKCQKRCVVSGKNGLHSRLHEIKPSEIHPSISARAAEILEDHSVAEAESVSPGVGALFRWVNQIINAVGDQQKDEKKPVKPAHRRQQNVIFRENTELSEGVVADDSQYIIREKTQSHFRTRSKTRQGREHKHTRFADEPKSRSRSRSTRSRTSSPDKENLKVKHLKEWQT